MDAPLYADTRIAVIFDRDVRPDTTGVYCLRALQSLCRTCHVRPGELGSVSRTAFDAYVCIDDGLDYRVPDDLRPLAFWAIDTHLDVGRLTRRACIGTPVFAAQQDGVERLRRAGVSCPGWLPLACDPQIHCRLDIPKEYDVAFIGHINSPARERLLTSLSARFPASFIGRARPDEIGAIYSRARVVFNRSIGNDINMRVYEGLACGAAVVTNDLSSNGQPSLFARGRHLFTYEHDDRAVETVESVLAQPRHAADVAREGRKHVIALHTYTHRMAAILRHLGLQSTPVRPPTTAPDVTTGAA